MSKFEESNFYKALQDFFINADKKTFLQFLAEFYNRTEGIIDKNNIQDELIKELRELYLEFNEKGIDENIVREKVNYFLENSVKIKDVITKLNINTTNIDIINSQLDTKTNKTETANIQQQVNNLVLGAVGDGNNAEVIQARGGFSVLNDRLNYSSIENIVDISINILNPNECIENASVGWSGGGYKLNVVSTEANFCLSPIINVSSGQKFIFNYKGYQTNIYLADDTFTINANNMLTIEANTPFTIPENVTKMRYRFTINGSDLNNGQWKNKVMLCKGISLPSNFTPYNLKVMKTNI